MKKRILVADADEALRQAFMTIFSKGHYEIIHASNGKEVERIADRMEPDIYVVNVNLPKTNGIEVYKRLQKGGFLEKASFFFLKDEADSTELLGYQADGVIEKPVNFFKVYETITKEDEVIELTDLIEEREKRESPRAHPGGGTVQDAGGDLRPGRAKAEGPAGEEGGAERPREEARRQDIIGERLRHAVEDITDVSAAMRLRGTRSPAQTGEAQLELEAQFKVVLNQAMEEAANKLSARLAPILTRYVEDYVKQMLLEIAEKVIREEIDKLLKESTA
jgi:CheY-like chemotaxis protein